MHKLNCGTLSPYEQFPTTGALERRRAFRIYPLCWACIALVLATGLTDMGDIVTTHMGWRSVMVNALLVQNVVHRPSVIGPLWSLPWEVQMYLLLPALYGITRRNDKPAVPLFLWLTTTGLALSLTAIGSHHSIPLMFPPMFIAGIVAFTLSRKVRPQLPSALWPIVVPGLLLLRCCMLNGDSFTSVHNFAVNAVFCLLVGIAIVMFREIRAQCVVQPAHVIAKYSYGIYLFHVPVLVFVFTRFASLPLSLKIASFYGITAGIAVAIFYLLEQPLINLGRRIAQINSPAPQMRRTQENVLRAATNE